MGLAAVCWAIWRTRNAVCFDKKRIKSPIEIMCDVLIFTYWSELHKSELEKQVLQDAETIKMIALLFHQQDMKTRAQE